VRKSIIVTSSLFYCSPSLVEIHDEGTYPSPGNVFALQKLIDTNVDALVIVANDRQQILGVVDRNHLIAKLMLKLAS
jgi:hypothetical protein